MTAPAKDASTDLQPGGIWQSRWLNSLGRFLAILVVYLFFALAVEDGKFYSPRVLESIVRQSAVFATAALGMTFIIVAGGIDLSVGSMIALTSVVVAWVLSLTGFAGGDATDIGEEGLGGVPAARSTGRQELVGLQRGCRVARRVGQQGEARRLHRRRQRDAGERVGHRGRGPWGNERVLGQDGRRREEDNGEREG